MVTLANLQDALDAKENAANNDPENEVGLLESFRLDAQHNETCFTNPNGDKIDLDSSGFSVDLPVDVANPQVLVMNEENGNITAELEDATIATICQYTQPPATVSIYLFVFVNFFKIIYIFPFCVSTNVLFYNNTDGNCCGTWHGIRRFLSASNLLCE